MPPTDAHERQKPRLKQDAHERAAIPRKQAQDRIVRGLSRRGSVRVSRSDTRHLPAIRPELERAFPGKTFELEGNRLHLREQKVTYAGMFGAAESPGWLKGARRIAGRAADDPVKFGTGVAGMMADYGTAFAKDVRDIPTRETLTGKRSLFPRTGRQLTTDALGTLAFIDAATPTFFLPELEIDPEARTVRRQSQAEDRRQAGELWSEDPLLAAAGVLPIPATASTRLSVASLTRSIAKANPKLSRAEARRIARKESRLPGYAAAQGYEGGIAPRILSGEYAEHVGRPYSRSALGRTGQRVYDVASEALERKRPGAKFSTSQRAARAYQRQLRKNAARMQAEIARLEREIGKGVGKSPPAKEALIAALEAPKGLTPRQAVEVKLADLRSTIERPRTRDEALARVSALEKELEATLRPLVDEAFPVASRRAEQARRNVLRGTKGKRAAQALDTALEHGGLGKGGSVLADAYAKVEAQVSRMAEAGSADPNVQRIAALIEERDALRAAASNPDAVFGEGLGDFGLTGATPESAARLEAQVRALEAALTSSKLESAEFARALSAMEKVSAQADETARTVLGMTDEELASRRNRIAQRYADKGLLPEGVEPEARGFFPHRDEFETIPGGMGAPTLAASGGVVGRPMPGRAFARKQNRLRMYEQGRVQSEPRVLTNTLRQRGRYMQSLEARRSLYERGRPIRAAEEVPEGTFLVRNPDTSPKKIDPALYAAIEHPERYAEITSRVGEHVSPETFGEWVKSWLYRGEEIRPEWIKDVENVRAVPERVVRTMLEDVFKDAPRGSFMSILGTLNALGRAVTIYLPYGGVRYVSRNTPQNAILLALTRPTAFLNLRRATTGLRRSDPELYQAIKVEAGTVPASAGLPELPGRKRSKAQRVEATVTTASRKVANALGEVSDEPWRVSSWIGYARAYGFKKPADWRRLMFSDDSALARVRNDIAQYVRDDMIDFDALPPGARENLGRVFFILPFVAGAAKWPLMYVREYPVRASIAALIAAQHSREGAGSVWEQGHVRIGERKTDLGWLDPTAPMRSSVERAIETGKAVPEGPPAILQELSGFFAPQYREPLRPYGGWEDTAKAFAPFYSTVEKLGRGGSIEDQALRLLGATVELRPSAVQKRRTALERDFERLGLSPDPGLAQAWQLQERLARELEGKKGARAKVEAAFRLAGRMRFLDRASVAASIEAAKLKTEHENEGLLQRIEYLFFGAKPLLRARTFINDALAAKGLEPSQ
jgi:hypothetical protein